MKPDPVGEWIVGLNIDGFTGATPLALQKFQHLRQHHRPVFSAVVVGSPVRRRRC